MLNLHACTLGVSIWLTVWVSLPGVPSVLLQAVAIAVPLFGGISGSVATASEIKTWYTTINKPSWTPPVSSLAATPECAMLLLACRSVGACVYAVVVLTAPPVVRRPSLPCRTSCLAPYGPRCTRQWVWPPTWCGSKEVPHDCWWLAPDC